MEPGQPTVGSKGGMRVLVIWLQQGAALKESICFFKICFFVASVQSSGAFLFA